MQKTINLNLPSAWSEGNANQIALQFGYVLNDKFIQAVKAFGSSVEGAVITDYISVLGENHLKNYQPPLDRVARR